MKLGRPLTVLMKSMTAWLPVKSKGRRGGAMTIAGLYRISLSQRYPSDLSVLAVMRLVATRHDEHR